MNMVANGKHYSLAIDSAGIEMAKNPGKIQAITQDYKRVQIQVKCPDVEMEHMFNQNPLFHSERKQPETPKRSKIKTYKNIAQRMKGKKPQKGKSINTDSKDENSENEDSIRPSTRKSFGKAKKSQSKKRKSEDSVSKESDTEKEIRRPQPKKNKNKEKKKL